MCYMGGAHDNVGPPQESSKDGAIVLFVDYNTQACLFYQYYPLDDFPRLIPVSHRLP